ncbi:unnamed protein product [Rotaria sp. Silwood2]|nr:unnamed protein product [Rotaria sp. Silwood2]
MCRSKPRRSNRTFVKFAFPKTLRSNLRDRTFSTGLWSSRHYRYYKWYGPHQIFLSFNSRSMTVTGSGQDDIGIFDIEGIYSYRNRRIGLRKIYRSDKFDELTKSEHEIIIQLIWNDKAKQFQGKCKNTSPANTNDWTITLCIFGSAGSNKRILSSLEDRYVYEYINDERQVIRTLIETKTLLSQRQLRIYIVDSFDVKLIFLYQGRSTIILPTFIFSCHMLCWNSTRYTCNDFGHYLGESVRKDYSDQITCYITCKYR